MADAFKNAARELHGIVNVGVVDCGKYNRELCGSIPEVKGFPTILAFYGSEKPVKFTDDRTRKNVIQFAKKYVTGKVSKILTPTVGASTGSTLCMFFDSLTHIIYAAYFFGKFQYFI
jgi:hypothetical protein